MKTKNLSKKLKINKKTIANLIPTEMKDVRGGYHYTFYPWVTCGGGTDTLTCGIGCTYTCTTLP